jgi:hypothetical protein
MKWNILMKLLSSKQSILIFKVVSDPACCMEHLFLYFHACMNYGLMFWSGDTGGIEIIWDYSNNQWCGETKL